MTLLHTVGFGSASVCLYQSLLNGASLFPFNYKLEGVDRLADWIKENQLTILHTPPAVFRQLAEFQATRSKLESLRLVRLSGSATTRLDFDLYRNNFPSTTSLEVHMGSTETGTITRALLDHRFVFPNDGVPVGYPTHGQSLFLIDEHNRQVPVGEVGEIVVKGRNLNTGYWGRSRLTTTNQSSAPHDLAEQIYRTGDLGRMLPDGFLIHIGRKDLMVKIRGYRVDFTEVEAALRNHRDVKDAGIRAWERDPGEKYIAGYIVLRQGAALDVSELREFLSNTLPDYMIPSTFIFLSSLPLTNGKLDRLALPKPGSIRPVLSQDYASPRTELERRLVVIWEEVLNIKPVGIHDNFFDLGGHSVAASRVVSRVIQTLQLDVPLGALFEAPTVAEMATVITQNQARLASEAELTRILREVEAMTEEETITNLQNLGGQTK
jgi:acyl-coenzyme A synthetase/AMP-(fatty) acid ligase